LRSEEDLVNLQEKLDAFAQAEVGHKGRKA